MILNHNTRTNLGASFNSKNTETLAGYCEWEMMVSGLDANVSSVADVRKGRVGSVHYGSENIQ
ncbi:hypothetical protein Tco_1365115, partial [Tanacetum coccineum]